MAKAPKRLTRGSDRILGGVVSGFANYLNADVTLLRILVFILMIATGVVPVLLTYLVAWVIMPER